MKEAPTLELVLKRNSIERLKRDKSPLGMLDELPALIAAGYEQVEEEDIVRLKWWGLYHDKPKIGTFMLRVKIPGGITSPAQLRAIGEISNVHGRGEGELSTRQNVQLHFIRLDALPDVFDRLHGAGLTSAGACGDTVRNITGCPLGGLAHDELFDPTPVLEEAAEFFYGNPDYSDLPRKLKIAITLSRRVLGARDQLHRADRCHPRWEGGVRRARRRWAVVGAADRQGSRDLGPEGRCRHPPGRDPR
jgi:sulfite reductase beta subunit-like hemoprotein